MAYKVRFSNISRENLDRAIEHNSKARSGYGNLLFKEFRSRLRFIKENPYACPIRYEDVRIKPLSRFPYTIHYFIEEGRKTIVILQFSHAAENPEKWKK